MLHDTQNHLIFLLFVSIHPVGISQVNELSTPNMLIKLLQDIALYLNIFLVQL